MDFPVGSVVNNPPASEGDTGSTPGLQRFPGEGNGNPLQYSCLGNPMDREAWQATVQWVAKRSGHNLPTKTTNNKVGKDVEKYWTLTHCRW